MTTYMTQRSFAGRHKRAERRWASILTIATTFILAVTSLTGGIILMAQAGMDVVSLAPAIVLVAFGGMVYAIMIFIAGFLRDA